ncbi:hypothetical protein F5878DRAFT_151897 [Lentinula raphanica]|uniref:Uncharacterized protein n=1 Tax=Lentinula raphanica TaxID=153919 RepID=A0AA38PA07_9AGAR|nr:hypothetical protein F5880DRAFT_1605852 [Lentinula raphanica]KAJ3838828.1 hypothetical protein F5878DRAFT_151897 [Lentinula raphanica]
MSIMINDEKPPRYLPDGRHNPALERKGLPKYFPQMLPPLQERPSRLHPRQVTLPPMNQFMQMTFASRHFDEPNQLPPTIPVPVATQGQAQSTSSQAVVPFRLPQISPHHPQGRPLPPMFPAGHEIWNLLRLTNYYLHDDIHYYIATRKHPQAITDLIRKFEADYRKRKTHPTNCYVLPQLFSNPMHPIWELLMLTDYDLPDEVRDGLNECRSPAYVTEICVRLLPIWREKYSRRT